MQTKKRALRQQFQQVLNTYGVEIQEPAIGGGLLSELVDVALSVMKRRCESDNAIEHQAFMAVLANVTKSDVTAKAGQLSKAAKLLRDSEEEYTAQNIMRWYSAPDGWWYKVYRAWVKQKDPRAFVSPPTIQQVLDTVKQAKDYNTQKPADDTARYTGGQYADIIQH